MSTPTDAFAEKAPLLEDIGLAKIVLFDLLAPEVREHVESVYVYGSFVDDSTELDRDGDTSDLDVYVTVADEVLPRVDGEPREVSTRFGASQHGLLCRCATQSALTVYGRTEPFDLSLRGVRTTPGEYRAGRTRRVSRDRRRHRTVALPCNGPDARGGGRLRGVPRRRPAPPGVAARRGRQTPVLTNSRGVTPAGVG
jgi:hypothetical protein